MCRSELGLALLWVVFAAPVAAAPPWHGLGAPIAPADYAAWDIDVSPDGSGLPAGIGSVADGQVIYDEQCASCHGFFGESPDYLALTGGIGSLAGDNPQRTVGSKLAHATTLWDYINRAMPFGAPKSLTPDQVYAVTAYVLHLNDILPADASLDRAALVAVRMPNVDGYTTEHGMLSVDGKGDVAAPDCRRDCAGEVSVSSRLPSGFAEQMYGDLRLHFRQLAHLSAGAPLPVGATAAASEHLEQARAGGCLVCHAVDAAGVGPAFRAVAARYASDDDAAGRLATKIRAGGSGNWGSTAMPPQTALDDGTLAAVVAWILDGAP